MLHSNRHEPRYAHASDHTTDEINVLLGQDVDGRLIKVEVATGIRGRRDRGDRDRGERHAGGRDRDFNRDYRYRYVI